MPATGHRKSIAVFITLGVCLVVLAVTLNVSWIVLNWRTGVLLIFGVLFFSLIIGGVVVNTVFLVREIRRNEQHNTFINAVTHELKTPVTSIRLYLETLQSRDIDDAKRREFYNIMLADSDRLMTTIEQVLSAGRIGQAHRKLHRTRIDLGKMVQECIALARIRHHLSPEALQCAGDFAAAAAEGETIVVGDIEELKAAVSNLLDNAIKYSGSQVRVLVEILRLDAKRVAVGVKDQGVGIPSSELKRIFKRFYRTPGAVAMRVKGTGLGLYIVSSIAAKHGGRVFAESEGADRGSTFTLQLPIAPAEGAGT